MTGASRLNGVIRAWESGKPAFASFASADRTTAIAFSTSPYDGVVFEMDADFSHDPLFQRLNEVDARVASCHLRSL